jgi:hypothetical protein
MISTRDRTIKGHKRKEAVKKPKEIEVGNDPAATSGKILAEDGSE